MKKIILLCVLSAVVENIFAQQQTFDITTFTPPKGWTKEEKQNVIVYTQVDKKNKTWCQIGVYKSTASKGSIENDLQSEWNEMAVKQFKITDAMQATETQEADGWKIKTGSGKFTFNNQPAAVLLTTFSGYDRCTSIIATTNSQSYLETIEKFIGSIDIKKPEISRPQPNVVNVPVIGSWGKSNTVSQVNNRFGNYSYNKQQYKFMSDGSYGFAAKTYDEKSPETYLIKEKGNFVISGNTITLTPKTSVIEAWSKKNGADNWNQLKSTQKRPLEIVTYQFSIANNNLLLQAEKQTQRDGNFNNGNTYSYGPPGTFTPIILPEGNVISSEEIHKEPVKQKTTPTNSSVTNSGFTFTSINFDDGWVAKEETDWVRVTKGNIIVLLHYAKEGTTAAADPEPHVNNAWNILVAPRYSNLKNYKVASPSLDPQRAYFGAGELTDNKTGNQVYVALFRKGSSNWVEFITPDKNTFVKEFGTDINNIGWDASSNIWNPLLKLINYNKFAVAADDLPGNWKSSSGAGIQYYNVYTGNNMGMASASSTTEFIFKSGGTYTSIYKGVDGFNGNNRYAGETFNGNSNVTNWEMKLTNRFKGATETFAIQFEAVKGGRILHMYRGNIEELHLYKTK